MIQYPHLFIVSAEIASAAVYTTRTCGWVGCLLQMQFIHTHTLTKGERKRICWSKAVPRVSVSVKLMHAVH